MITAASINPGRMDRRLTLRYSLATRNASGESVASWVDGATVWGSWLPRGGREFIAAQAKHAEATGIFRIRHRVDVDATWRLVHGDDLFEVIVPEEVGRREYLDLIVRALDQSPGSALSVEILHGDDAGAIVLLHDSSPQLMQPAA